MNMAPLTIEEHEAHLLALRERNIALDVEYAGRAFPDDVRIEWNETNEEIEVEEDLVRELRARREHTEILRADIRDDRERELRQQHEQERTRDIREQLASA
jgi:hypothetical protein